MNNIFLNRYTYWSKSVRRKEGEDCWCIFVAIGVRWDNGEWCDVGSNVIAFWWRVLVEGIDWRWGETTSDDWWWIGRLCALLSKDREEEEEEKGTWRGVGLVVCICVGRWFL